MKKKLLAALLAVCIILTVVPAGALAASGLGNFKTSLTYTEGQFTDVSASDWYGNNVATAYRLGLVKGQSSSYFNADGYVTIAETIAMAARIHSIYYNGTGDFEQGSIWYRVYVDYALENGIISEEYVDYDRYATRAEYASIMSKALPEDALQKINDITDGQIPDVPVTVSYASAVYELYRAGILTGSDSRGTFNPQSSIKRSEVAAIITRMADKSLRREFTLSAASSDTLSAEEIASRSEAAVFYIVVYDSTGTALRSGSGFFIDSDGTAVTNFHVVKNCASAKVTLSDGTVRDVEGIYDSDEDRDIVLLKVSGSGYTYLTAGDSSAVATGATVYALGSPLGLSNTFSQGIVSNTSRVVDGQTYIQTTAAISSGSSGGALLDASGKVIGVTSATYVEGQNLNLAVPINSISSLSKGSLRTLDSGTSSASSSGSVTPSKTAVSVKNGSTAYVTFTSTYTNKIYLTYSLGNTGYVSCTWGDWSGDNVILGIRGLKTGSTTIDVDVLDDSTNTIISTIRLTVTVTSTSSTSYYSGLSPIPDFGAFAGVSTFYTKSSNGEYKFAYRLDQISISAQEAVYGYNSLLKESGFSAQKSDTNDDGYTRIYYTSSLYSMVVTTELAKMGSYTVYLVSVSV